MTTAFPLKRLAEATACVVSAARRPPLRRRRQALMRRV